MPRWCTRTRDRSPVTTAPVYTEDSPPASEDPDTRRIHACEGEPWPALWRCWQAGRAILSRSGAFELRIAVAQRSMLQAISLSVPLGNSKARHQALQRALQELPFPCLRNS